jgi:hypothetical protein
MSREMTPTEQRAVRRVQRAIAQMPKTIGLYFHGDSATVLACDDDGIMLRKEGGEDFDPDATLDVFDTPRCAAGDW